MKKSKKNYSHQILLLSFLVAITVMLNFALIVMIEANRGGTVQERIIRTFTGDSQLDLFSSVSLAKNINIATWVSKKNVVTKTRSTSTKLSSPKTTSRIYTARNGVVLDFDKKIGTVNGKTYPIIIDEGQPLIPYQAIDVNKDGVRDLVRKEVDGKVYSYRNYGTNAKPIYKDGTIYSGKINFKQPSSSSSINSIASPQGAGETHLNVILNENNARFDMYIDTNYYIANTQKLNEFFYNFQERYLMLEQQTGWSSEEYYGVKLEIHVNSTAGCWDNGLGGAGYSQIRLHNNLSDSNCRGDYYDEFNGSFHYENPGELGDQWIYMTGLIHESLHAINPPSIASRPWLTEGWSQYYEYNILSDYVGNAFSDINQPTADTYIYLGHPWWSWERYVANDYHDTCTFNNPFYCLTINATLQGSRGYDITAWMFSMMRDNHGLDWNEFYQIMEDNPETMTKALALKSISEYYIDSHVIDLFGRASGLNFPQTKAIWQYDGPSGPGWGVRNWQNLDWSADLVPRVSFIDPSLPGIYIGENVTITANVANNGQVNLNNVSVKIYEGANLLEEQIVNVNAGSVVPVSVVFTSATPISYNIRTVVDENNIKIESNENNNEDTESITFQNAKCGDLDNSGAIDILDVVNMVNVAFRGQAQGNNPAWVWDVDTSGAIDIIDVVKIVNVAFRGANEETELTCSGGIAFALSQNDANELTEILKGYRIDNADLNKYVDSSLS